MSQRIRGPPPPFIDTRRGGVHVRRGLEVVVLPPNRWCAVDVYCRKYTVWHWRSWRRACSCPRRHPWSCGGRAGVLTAPVGVVAVVVEGTVLQAWRGRAPRVLRAGALL